MKVIQLFEAGELKDQKLSRKGSQITIPEFKQQYLQPIQCLPVEFQVKMLTKVVNKEVSFKDLKAAAANFRKLELIKRSFCRLTNMDSIEMAKEKYPIYASDEKLSKYIHLDFSTTPTAFHSYCRSAIASTSTAMPSTTLEIVSIQEFAIFK